MVDPFETPVDIVEAPIDFVEPAVNLLEASVDLLEASVDIAEALVDPVKAFVYPVAQMVQAVVGPALSHCLHAPNRTLVKRACGASNVPRSKCFVFSGCYSRAEPPSAR